MTYEPRLVRHGKRGARDRGEDPARVGHHVADDVDPPEDAFAPRASARAVVRAEEEPGEAVGLDPVVLLGHREVAAAEPGLDVRERNRRVSPPHGRRRRSSSCRRRRGRGRALRRAIRSAIAGCICAVSEVWRSSRYRGSARPSWSKKTCDMTWNQCCPVCSTTSSIPASRSAAESGAALMNCGRFPTTVKTFIRRSLRTRHRCGDRASLRARISLRSAPLPRRGQRS